MRKLKLESLQVESFETVSRMPETRGTVQGHRPNTDGCAVTIAPGTGVSDCYICEPMSRYGCESINICKDTEWLDCTFGCWITRDGRNSCEICWIDESANCPVE